jgi:hypothetical protein
MTERPRSAEPGGVGMSPETAARPDTRGRSSMRSPRGLLGTFVLLLALSIAGVPSRSEPPASIFKRRTKKVP